MPIEITMPQLSDTMTEGTVVKWLKREGEKVKAGEIVAEVETDKATMEMESFEGGTLAHIAAKEGDKVAVGQVIAYLASAKEDVEQVRNQVGGAAASETKSASSATSSSQTAPVAKAAKVAEPVVVEISQESLAGASVGEMREPDHVGHSARRGAGSAGSARGDYPPEPARDRDDRRGGRIFATPVARRVAGEKGLDLSGVDGSGPGGRIVKRDVLAAMSKPAARPGEGVPAAAESRRLQPDAVPVLAARVGTGRTEAVALTKMRSVIAQRLQAAKQNIPHVYETIDMDAEELVALRARLNQQLEREGVRLSLADLLHKAVASALIEHPQLNATFDGTQITRYGDVNLGIAVALPEGLIVPVLRGINQMGFREIRLRTADLVDRARAQRLRREEMSGATFTVSNLGSTGIREFTAIINPPEVGILAVGAAEKRAVVRNDQIVPRTMMTLTLSVDHRAVDGAPAAEFLRSLKGLLEEPGLMLI